MPGTSRWDLAELERMVGMKLTNHGLFLQAFTHSSFSHERKNGKGHPDNERLEFLGDAVLELAVSEYLYRHFPGMSEGELTRTRARIVCESSLAGFARELDFGSYVRVGKGEELTGGRNRPSLLADVFEAFVGALFLEKGLDGVREFLGNFVFPKLDDRLLGGVTDAKSQLQERVQHLHLGQLQYRIIDVQGPAHDRHFVAEVLLDGRPLGRGSGRSKKEAEQMAAAEALKIHDLK